MGVLNHIDRRGIAGQRRGIDQSGQPPPTGIRIDLGQLHIGVGEAQQVIEEHQVLRICVRNPVAQLIAGSPGSQTLNSCSRAQEPSNSVKGNLAGVRLTEGYENLHPTRRGHSGKLTHQTAFPDTRRPLDAHHSAAAVDGTVQQARDGRHLPLPTD